jgi:CelD/BcsL family acetyltransferase involved in cellulose biosynthesis
MDGDERWRGTSPGLLIVVEAMRWARRHGLSYLDLTVGDLDYKERMGAQTSDLHEIAEALTWWGAAILHAGRVVAVCRTWLRGHPELFERLRALRRSIRKWRERSIQ